MGEVVFIVGAELSGESKVWKNEGFAGGFVNCVTFAQNIPSALDKCEKALKEDGYSIAIFNFAYIYDPSEFVSSDETLEAVNRLKSESHEVQYGNFHVYGH